MFFSSIVYGEVSKMLQGPLVHRIFTAKKNIGLWGILYLFCYWWCCPFPISSPLPSMLFFHIPIIFLHFPQAPFPLFILFPLSPPTADIYTSTFCLKKKKKVLVPSVFSSLFRLHFPQMTRKQNSDTSKLPLPSFLVYVPRVNLK